MRMVKIGVGGNGIITPGRMLNRIQIQLQSVSVWKIWIRLTVDEKKRRPNLSGMKL